MRQILWSGNFLLSIEKFNKFLQDRKKDLWDEQPYLLSSIVMSVTIIKMLEMSFNKLETEFLDVKLLVVLSEVVENN